MIKLNNLKEAKDFLKKGDNIYLQNKTFFSFENFSNFVKEIENGNILEMPKNHYGYTWYTNFGTIYCNKLIVTKENLYFFDNEKLIFEKKRNIKDDIEYGFCKNNKCHCSGNPFIYNYEQKKQYIDLNPIHNIW